jgi:phage FluMu protein gp41
VANSITVVSERIDGTDPIRVTVRNNDSTSPTQFGDRFGRISQVIKIQTPLTASAAQQLAKKQLTAMSALAEQWSVQMVPDATLEPGDTVRLTYRGQSSVQVIDSITYPLTTDGLMTLNTRSSIAPPASAAEGTGS